MRMRRWLQWWVPQRRRVPADPQDMQILISGALNSPQQDHRLTTDWKCYFSCKSHVNVGIG